MAPKIGFQDRLSLNAAQKYCRIILSTFIKLPFVIKIVVLSIFEWPLKTGFTVYTKYPACRVICQNVWFCVSSNSSSRQTFPHIFHMYGVFLQYVAYDVCKTPKNRWTPCRSSYTDKVSLQYVFSHVSKRWLVWRRTYHSSGRNVCWSASLVWLAHLETEKSHDVTWSNYTKSV